MNINPLATLDAVQPANLDTGPVVVLNLLKFKPGDSLTPYLEYIRQVMARCSDSGIELIYAGKLKEKIQGEIGDWDVVLVVRYPSRRHCYEMFRSEAYQAINYLAAEALEKRVLWPSDPLLPYKTRTIEFEGGEWLKLLAQ